MKGIVFTEFQELVESQFGLELFDRIVEESNLPSGGSYTAVGTYDEAELLQLVQRLSNHSGVEVADLVRAFGRYLFGRFAELYGKFFEGIESAVEFLGNVDNYIHVEVRKLYPDAALPKIEFEQRSDDQWELRYSSTRPFADLAHGLIEATLEHFDRHPLELQRHDVPESNGTEASFLLTVKERVPAWST